MKLSEAILKGCETIPIQLRLVPKEGDGTMDGGFRYWNGAGEVCRACSIGTAMAVLGLDVWDLRRLYGEEVVEQVMKENEYWTREQIAASLAECGL